MFSFFVSKLNLIFEKNFRNIFEKNFCFEILELGHIGGARLFFLKRCLSDGGGHIGEISNKKNKWYIFTKFHRNFRIFSKILFRNFFVFFYNWLGDGRHIAE